MSQRKISRKAALCVLIHEAGLSAAGTGVGIRETLTEERRELVALSIVKLWKEAHGFEPDSNVLFPYGLNWPTPTGDNEGEKTLESEDPND